MTRPRYDKDSILDTAMQIIKDEYDVFVNDESDNSEYIPRILRIAESAGALFLRDGMAKSEVEANVSRIVEFGRRLFIQEWMRPIMGDPEPPREQDAVNEFDQYLKRERKAKRQRARLNPA